MNVRVKICGITSQADALAAVEAGADALGFMFYEQSPRFVSPRIVAEIVPQLPPFLARVGVFVNPTEEAVRRAVLACALDTLQFHGDEPPEFCRRFGVKVIKAFRVDDAASLQALPAYRTDAWLLDSCVPGLLGGTGAKFNWDLAVEAKRLGRPIILAGGLTPENIGEAVRRVQPYAVDVSSGVEMTPGRKDPARMRAFVQAAKATTVANR
jgi:phosphoribosylanthranilate isomerase